MPMKPNKFGIKVWLLVDADTYYVPCFQVYLGKNQTNSSLDYYVGSEKHIHLWTVHTNRKDYASDLKMKLVPGEVRTCHNGNLIPTMWRDKPVVTLLSYRLTLLLNQKFVQHRGIRSKFFQQMQWKSLMLWMFTMGNEWGQCTWPISQLWSTWNNYS